MIQRKTVVMLVLDDIEEVEYLVGGPIRYTLKLAGMGRILLTGQPSAPNKGLGLGTDIVF